MSSLASVKTPLAAVPTGEASVLNASNEFVTLEKLDLAKDLGIIFRSSSKMGDLSNFAQKHGDLIQAALLERGAVLFRGFNIKETTEFEKVIQVIAGAALEYRERTSPRHRVNGNIYTSTDYPANQSIFAHNENSYALVFPLKLFFCCLISALKGGETPIINTRAVFQRIDPQIKNKFMRTGWMYVRNFGKVFGLPWQTVFQTEDKQAVEEYCRHTNIEFEWKPDNGLKTWQVRPCAARHPKTGQPVWFNHATFFHVSTLPAAVRDFLLAEFGDNELPNNTFYGDGTPIEPEVLDHLRAAYQEETVKFPWQQGDVLLVDNMLTGHAREPFEGPRKVVVGMAEPTKWDDVLLNSNEV